MLIDYELEYLLLYYTSSLRKADDNITAYISKLKENERFLKKREKLKQGEKFKQLELKNEKKASLRK